LKCRDYSDCLSRQQGFARSAPQYEFVLNAFTLDELESRLLSTWPRTNQQLDYPPSVHSRGLPLGSFFFFTLRSLALSAEIDNGVN